MVAVTIMHVEFRFRAPTFNVDVSPLQISVRQLEPFQLEHRPETKLRMVSSYLLS